MKQIDGAYGEGGGQLARTACALAALTGQPIELVNIRARRPKPGLAPQHLAAVRAVAALCGADTAGLATGARELRLHPGPLRGGEYRFDVGTAGSITLVLQACLPVALACRKPVRMVVTGGSDVRAAPPLDYLRFVLLPILALMGAQVSVEVRRRGYYPRGGGEVEVAIAPGALRPLQLEAPGPLEGIGGVAHVANLPAHIAERMARTAEEVLLPHGGAEVVVEHLGRAQAIGAGGAIALWARCAHALLGAGNVAERGVPAEEIARVAAESLAAELGAQASLDIHAADQILVYCALARGESRFRARELSSHTRTTLWLLRQFLPLEVEERRVGALTELALSAR